MKNENTPRLHVRQHMFDCKHLLSGTFRALSHVSHGTSMAQADLILPASFLFFMVTEVGVATTSMM